MKRFSLAAIALLSLALLALFGFGWGLDPLLDACVKRLPPGIEKQLGEKLRGPMLEKEKLAGPREAKILDGLAKKLPGFEALGAPHILLIDDDVVNAFALPDGSIVLHRGLLRRLKRQDELIAVLGHESGHLLHRHALRRLIRSSLLGVGVSLLLGDASGASAALLGSARDLSELSFSRQDERQADDNAIACLHALGLDPGAAARAMQRLQESENERGYKVPEFLSTHPGGPERILRLQQEAQGLPVGKKKLLSDRDWKILQGSGNKKKN